MHPGDKSGRLRFPPGPHHQMNPHQRGQPGMGLPQQSGSRNMFGGMIPTPSGGQLAYPGGIYQQRQDSARQIDGMYDIRREDQQRKRPSMMSDFHLAHNNYMGPLAVDIAGQRGGDLGLRGCIDPRKMGPAYTPQVENISPTPEDQPDCASVTSAAQIAEKLQKVEKVIRGVDSQIKNLEKKKQELEISATDGSGSTEQTEEREQNLFERIYAEGRKKAAASHAKLEALNGPLMHSLPLYHEPSDTAIYHENQKKFEEFKPRLVQYLKKLQHARQLREKYLTERYNMMMQSWKKKVERMEKHPKRIAKEQRNREIFEKVFPELKKQREERERLVRTTISTRSGSILGSGNPEDTIEILAEPEDEDRKLRQQAVVPPMLLDPRTRARLKYLNNNGLVREPLAEYEYRLDTFTARWTDEEKRIFKEKLLQYGKNFAAIALFLERKNTKDCVKYYYLTKKRENYKQLMRKQFKGGRKGKMYRPPQMPRLGESGKEERKAENDGSDEAVKPEPEYFCISCKEKIDSALNPGRVLTRACYEQYGLDPQAINPQDVRICQKCRLGIIKKKHNHCPIGSCQTARRRVKPTRPLPSKWKELSKEQRILLAQQLQIADESTKCCSGCHKRITRRVEAVLSGEEMAEELEPPVNNEEESQSAWSQSQADSQPAWTDQENVKTSVKTEQTAKPPTAKVPGIESEEEDNSEDDTALAIIEDPNSDSPCRSPAVEKKPLIIVVKKPEPEEPVLEKIEKVCKVEPEIITCDSDSVKKEREPEIIEESEDTAAEAATSLAVSKLVASLDRDLCRSQESVKSSGESNATLSADEGHSETEGRHSVPKVSSVPRHILESSDGNFLGKRATERAATERGRQASALAHDALPKIGSAPPPIYKPKFRLLETDADASREANTASVPASISISTSNTATTTSEATDESKVIQERRPTVMRDIIDSSVTRNVIEEGLGVRQQKKIPVGPCTPLNLPEKSESPDIQIIGQKQSVPALTLQPPKVSGPSPASPFPRAQKSPISRIQQGSITAGTPVRQPSPATHAGPSGVQMPHHHSASTGTMRHSMHHPYEGLLRPATPFPLSRDDQSRPASTERARVSPLVFSHGGILDAHLTGGASPAHFLQAAGAQQAHNQALMKAQQQYRQALAMGYNEQQSLALYQQAYQHIMPGLGQQQAPSSRQILDDFRTSLQMPHLAGLTAPGPTPGGNHTEQAQQALLQQQFYGHHIREEQRRQAESQARLAQERERLAQEQQRALALAQAAEHQHRAALLGRHLALAQAANEQYKEHLATAAVAEHNQRALAMAQSDAQRRAMTGMVQGGYMTAGAGQASAPVTTARVTDVGVKSEPKSPLISPALHQQQYLGKQSIGTSAYSLEGSRQSVIPSGPPQGHHSVIQETKPEIPKKRSDTPIISKGAMKEFPPSLQAHQQREQQRQHIAPSLPRITQPKREAEVEKFPTISSLIPDSVGNAKTVVTSKAPAASSSHHSPVQGTVVSVASATSKKTDNLSSIIGNLIESNLIEQQNTAAQELRQTIESSKTSTSKTSTSKTSTSKAIDEKLVESTREVTTHVAAGKSTETPSERKLTEAPSGAKSMDNPSGSEKGATFFQQIESTIISQFKQEEPGPQAQKVFASDATTGQKVSKSVSSERKGDKKEAQFPQYDFENVSPVSSPEPEVSARASPASSIHSERPVSVHSSAGQSQAGGQPVYNVFSLPPTVLGHAASDPELTLAVQSISGGEERPENENLTEGDQRKGGQIPQTDADQEAAAAVMNLPNYEPLSDEES